MERKRNDDQVREYRALVAELMMQGYTQVEMTNIINERRGLNLSRSTIARDVGIIRRDWLETQRTSYEALMNEELLRLDVLEREMWRTLRESSEGMKRIVTDKIVNDGNLEDAVIKRVTETIEQSGVNNRLFDQILECQKERRRLLGLYAPTGVSVHKEIVVKGYQVVSPEDWPEPKTTIIEGEME
jgi:hypothetical protein